MESSSANRFITPTLQSNWNYAINEVLRRMNNETMFSVWKSIQTLYRILPPAIYDKVKSDYKKIVRIINDVNDGVGVDYSSMVDAHNEVNMTIENWAIPFFRTMYEFLYNGGYLEKLQREIPTGTE